MDSKALKDELFDSGLLYCDKCGRKETKEVREAVRTDRTGKLAKDLNAITIHHIIPKVRNGSDDESNLIPLCAHCHRDWHTYDSRRKSLEKTSEIYSRFLDWMLVEGAGPPVPKEPVKIKEIVQLSQSKKQLVINETTEILLCLKKLMKEQLNVEVQLILKQL